MCIRDRAQSAAEKAYAPYSKFNVGAALLTKTGRVYTGCNVENASFGATICAERTAVVKAISNGDKEFQKIAIYTNSGSSAPCGICRQVLTEFAPEMIVVYKDNNENLKETELNKLLSDAFLL